MDRKQSGGGGELPIPLKITFWVMNEFRSATSRAELGVLIFLVVGFALSTVFVVFKYYHLRKIIFSFIKIFQKKNLVLKL